MVEQEQLQQNVSTTVDEAKNLSEFLQTRPFAPVNKSHTASSEPGIQPNLQTKSDRTNNLPSRASNFGHSFGNLMVSPPTRSVIQAKLTIGQPGDKYEQEADRMAADVVQRINQPQPMSSKQGETVQRVEVPEEEELQMKPLVNSIQRVEVPEEEELQMKPLVNSIQRVEVPEEEELQMKPLVNSIQRMEVPEEEELQMKPLLQRQEAIDGGQASTDLESSINSARGGGQSLDKGLQRSMGQAMGADFSGVRVHTDSQADQLNKSIQAKAFTTGQDVFFRQGTYEPGSRGGQELIAHELTHVVQQNSGAVQRLEDIAEEAQLVNFRTIKMQDDGAGHLNHQFTWESSTGRGEDIGYIQTRENVSWEAPPPQLGGEGEYSGAGMHNGLTITSGSALGCADNHDVIPAQGFKFNGFGNGNLTTPVWKLAQTYELNAGNGWQTIPNTHYEITRWYEKEGSHLTGYMSKRGLDDGHMCRAMKHIDNFF